ncbi:acetyl-CoA C-acyltransferase [Streptosporangium sp. NPDC049644]|uniref:acetyl-CoA C-acyltransferase n=1 Tax=Streptosporangium sp. NPDC049644 TaxID=3155507 RepID=UPI003421BD6E
MTDVYVLATLRTPRGKGRPGGGLSGITPLELLTRLLAGVGDRAAALPGLVEDLIVGSATQTGEQGGDLARTAAVLAGWGESASGMTLNRFCASGVDAINTAAAHIAFGSAGLIAAGGVESVSRVPMFADQAPIWSDREVVERVGSVQMGIAADLIATLEGLEREQLDGYALRSQRRAAAAWEQGRFAGSLLPVRHGDQVVLDHDETVRPGTTAESLAALEPAFAALGAKGQDDLVRRRRPEVGEIRHLHTAGSSPAIADGAGIAVLGDAAAAAASGLRPRARVVAAATAAVDPVIMLTAGQAAAEKALKRAGLVPGDVDVFEIAEAFAATCLKFQRDLGVTDEQLNPNGGTIAMGHAFGATGPILLASCVDELERTGGRYGVVAVSGAAGTGSATVLERVP